MSGYRFGGWSGSEWRGRHTNVSSHLDTASLGRDFPSGSFGSLRSSQPSTYPQEGARFHTLQGGHKYYLRPAPGLGGGQFTDFADEDRKPLVTPSFREPFPLPRNSASILGQPSPSLQGLASLQRALSDLTRQSQPTGPGAPPLPRPLSAGGLGRPAHPLDGRGIPRAAADLSSHRSGLLPHPNPMIGPEGMRGRAWQSGGRGQNRRKKRPKVAIAFAPVLKHVHTETPTSGLEKSGFAPQSWPPIGPSHTGSLPVGPVLGQADRALDPIPNQWAFGPSRPVESIEREPAHFHTRYELDHDPQPIRSHSAPGPFVEPRHVSDVPRNLMGRLGAQPRGYEGPSFVGRPGNGGRSPLWSGEFGRESRERSEGGAWGSGGGDGGRVFGERGVANGDASHVMFECRPCNREYKTSEAYQAHLQSHRKCQHCDFEALPRCLRDHELVHFLPEELKFSSEGDISKWRNDRRKNYPTAANVERKEMQHAARQDRGQVAETPLYRYINRLIGEEGTSSRRGSWRGRGRGRGRGGRGKGQRSGGQNLRKDTEDQFIVLSDYEAPSEDQAEGGKEEGEGGGPIPEGEEDTSVPKTWWEDREGGVALEGVGEGQSEAEERVVGAVMTTLERGVEEEEEREDWGRGGWKRSREEEGEGEASKRPRLEEGVEDKDTTRAEGGPTGKHQARRGGKGKGKQRPAYHPPQWRQNKGAKGKFQRNQPNRAQGTNAKADLLRRLKPQEATLLEKLLAPEVRREQNTLLQCIRHIVREEFSRMGGGSMSLDQGEGSLWVETNLGVPGRTVHY